MGQLLLWLHTHPLVRMPQLHQFYPQKGLPPRPLSANWFKQSSGQGRARLERSVLVYLETGNDIITSSSTTSHHHFWSGQGCDGLGPVWPAGTGQPTGGHHQQHSSSTDFTGVNYFHTGRCFILMCQAQNHLGVILHFKMYETLHLTQWQYFDEVIPLSLLRPGWCNLS